MKKIHPMFKYKLRSYINKSFVFFILLVFFSLTCHDKEISISSTTMIREFKKLPKNKLTVIKFESDTIKSKLDDHSSVIYRKIFAKNTGSIPLHVATVVASCNCTKVKFDKKIVFPNDSLGITLILKRDRRFITSALTIVGNVPNGQKTIFLLFQ